MTAETRLKAVIDIGTNTINLLIARQEGQQFETQDFVRIPAGLGKGGMQKGILTEEAMQRGVDALAAHKASCISKGIHPDLVKVTATSAVRTASNRGQFIKRVHDELELDIQVIDGDREAELIWKGVGLTGLLEDGAGLIMDIGGGSTEFIIADTDGLRWKKSYKLGVTRMKERFEATDPFTEQQVEAMRDTLAEELHELWDILGKSPVSRLIGASGSFNSIDLMLAKGDVSALPDMRNEINIKSYTDLSETLRSSNAETRATIPGLVPDRVDTIAYAALLIDLVIERAGIDSVWRSTYALKEGLMSEIM